MTPDEQRRDRREDAGCNGIASAFFLSVALVCALSACAERTRESASDAHTTATAAAGIAESLVVPNDNRTPAGELREGDAQAAQLWLGKKLKAEYQINNAAYMQACSTCHR